MAKEESSKSADAPGGKDQPVENAGSSGRTRSPNFPSMDLKKAVEKTEILHRHNKRFLVPALSALKHLGYSTAGSSGALQTIGALKAYGLIETDGSGEERKIRVSEAGAQIVLGHPNRDAILKKAALTPPLFAEVWALRTEDGLPSNDALRHFLLWDRKFNDSSIPTFVASFRDTLAYAGLDDADKISNVDNESLSSNQAPVAVKIGDLVQWTCNGTDMFDKPRKVLGFYSDEYAFVEGSTTGVLISELTVMNSHNPNPPEAIKSSPRTPPSNPFMVAKAEQESHQPPSGIKEDAYDLAEGRAVFRWPEKLDPASVGELEEWFKLIIRKMRRITGAKIAVGTVKDVAKTTGPAISVGGGNAIILPDDNQ